MQACANFFFCQYHLKGMRLRSPLRCPHHARAVEARSRRQGMARKRRLPPLVAPSTDGRDRLAAKPADGVVEDNMLLLAMQLCWTSRPTDPRALLKLLSLSSRFSQAVIESFGYLRSVWVHFNLPGKRNCCHKLNFCNIIFRCRRMQALAPIAQ